MRAYNGFEAKRSVGASELLPAGGYVAKIMSAKVEEYSWGEVLVISFDIAEGEHKGFFKAQYDANTAEDKKYKGNATIYVPKDDGSEKDGWTKKSFAGWTNAFEESNQGYSWDWDEKKWKGKLVGIVFGDTGTVIEGKEIVYTEPRFAVPAAAVRSGLAPAAKFKAKNGYTGNGSNSSASSSDGFMNIPDGVIDELPFN